MVRDVPDGPALVLPDAELLVVDYLKATLGIAPDSVAVCTIAPQDLTPPLVRVRRIGGAWKYRKVLDDVTLDVDVWDATPYEVNQLIGDVRAALEAAAGYNAGAGGRIAHSRELAGPSWRPETNPALVRKGLMHQLLIRPA